ncbi:MAG TPA: crotonyl-CoA carboxylase/reductase [Dehalococcoidia bacterium]|nr:crotonyl-CoA carboxylase/reductase [Dehalococcoidia bacterium]
MADEKEIYALGEMPPLGFVPKRMHASVIREERFGEPKDAFKIEEIDVPDVGPKEVLVYVMAAGTNYNNVWAGLGAPVNVINARQRKGAEEDFHIGGSDASGIVWAKGDAVTNVEIGDQVVISCGRWDEEAEDVKAGVDPITSLSNQIWGYETNWGSFAQFTLVDHYQLHPKPPQLTWEAAAAYMLTGATAWRMLHGWEPHTVQEGDPVLVWGGTGGLGSMAIQIVREAGGIPIAVVSDESKFEFCLQMGAQGVINRKEFDHWGRLPDIDDAEAIGEWMQGAGAFRNKFSEVLGRRGAPKIIFEHPGEATIPTSTFLVDNAGMVVVCAGTSGYNADVDLRFLWMRQKRLQGSHFANTEQCREFNDMVAAGRIDPALSRTFQFDEIGLSHQLMKDNEHPPGNMAILVNATEEGMTDLPA